MCKLYKVSRNPFTKGVTPKKGSEINRDNLVLKSQRLFKMPLKILSKSQNKHDMTLRNQNKHDMTLRNQNKHKKVRRHYDKYHQLACC